MWATAFVRKIDEALAHCRCGLVILSQHFLRRVGPKESSMRCSTESMW
jgi:hypothetical protein